MADKNEPEEIRDVIIIGGGIIGCFTAWHLAQQGQRVLLLEQFNHIPHSWGSSAGESRCIRKAYIEEGYSELMKKAYEMWTDFENMTQNKFLWKTGMLLVDKGDGRNVKPVKDKLDELGYPNTTYSSEDLRKHFPTINFKDHIGLFDHDGGVLDVHNIFKSLLLLIDKLGGKIQTGVKVQNICPGTEVTLTTNRGKYRAKKVVLTTGPWTADITKSLELSLPLRVKAATVWFWKEKKFGSYSLDTGFPVFADYNIESWNDFIYAVPCYEYPNMLKLHMHHTIEHSIHPDYRDAQMTPDYDFILDKHPMWDNIVIGAGFSGHGFKLSPLIGKLLANMVLEKPITIDMKPFKISRFQKATWKFSKL
ncbi:peroxisomal sarcosine oxidase isoform X2 [Lingula anatina]|uniref:Peroxisomal sarcosine oxidase isoform X2 n=1 Tax=Lingula anatina TaxID=7574 RepID=A0A1S3KGK5_LINAN|nr:peroxisomal sarcosine oxidase isoform X2 [Lingula anatina]|eukprot:XP_013421768.1 peroxisomal sarcosine oxidase isoform X2 [Lingula anatina]